jgi:hypothetical protein
MIEVDLSKVIPSPTGPKILSELYDPMDYMRYLETIIPDHELGSFTQKWMKYHWEAVIDLWIDHILTFDDPNDAINLDYFAQLTLVTSLFHYHIDGQIRGQIEKLTASQLYRD